MAWCGPRSDGRRAAGRPPPSLVSTSTTSTPCPPTMARASTPGRKVDRSQSAARTNCQPSGGITSDRLSPGRHPGRGGHTTTGTSAPIRSKARPSARPALSGSIRWSSTCRAARSSRAARPLRGRAVRRQGLTRVRAASVGRRADGEPWPTPGPAGPCQPCGCSAARARLARPAGRRWGRPGAPSALAAATRAAAVAAVRSLQLAQRAWAATWARRRARLGSTGMAGTAPRVRGAACAAIDRPSEAAAIVTQGWCIDLGCAVRNRLRVGRSSSFGCPAQNRL